MTDQTDDPQDDSTATTTSIIAAATILGGDDSLYRWDQERMENHIAAVMEFATLFHPVVVAAIEGGTTGNGRDPHQKFMDALDEAQDAGIVTVIAEVNGAPIFSVVDTEGLYD